MGALVRRVCEVARPKLNALGVRVDLNVSDVLPVIANPVELELGLLNLLTNSLDAMPSGGVVTITVTPGPDTVCIDVTDTGKGIAPDLLPRIFDAWVTTKEAGHGTGLGLSITREVIEAHGGTITARSEAGAGATFILTLPGSVERVEDGATV